MLTFALPTGRSLEECIEILEGSGLPEAKLHDFWPYGYDERQFCSPGFNLPVGLFQRSLYGSTCFLS